MHTTLVVYVVNKVHNMALFLNSCMQAAFYRPPHLFYPSTIYSKIEITFQSVIIIIYPQSNLLLGGEDVGITGINDGNNGAVEELTACSTKLGVVTRVVVDSSLGKHGKVLNLGLAEGRAVRGDENQLGLAPAKRLDRGFVAKDGLARLHDQLESRIHVLDILLLYSPVGRGVGEERYQLE